jgi:hypothetical protein
LDERNLNKTSHCLFTFSAAVLPPNKDGTIVHVPWQPVFVFVVVWTLMDLEA